MTHYGHHMLYAKSLDPGWHPCEREVVRLNIRLELWHYRSGIIPVWWQIARKFDVPDVLLNVIGSFLTSFINNDEDPLPIVPCIRSNQ